jgi:membrane fusion protein
MTGTSLFRQEVIDAKRGSFLGAIRLTPPRLGWVFLSLAFLTLLTLVSILVFGRYTRYEKVSGSLVPSKGLLTIRPLTPGVVTRVMVSEGQSVRSGEVLAILSDDQASASLGDAEVASIEQLKLKRSKLQLDLEEQKQLADAQQKDLQSRIDILRTQLNLMSGRVELQRKRADSAMALYEQWNVLSQSGVVSKLQVLQQHDAAFSDLALVKELLGETLSLRQQLVQLQSQSDQLPANTLTKRNETERQIADVDQSLSLSEVKHAQVLRANADGIIENVMIHAGQSVDPDQPLITIFPRDAVLLAELWVPTRAAGYITPGDRVVLRYQAYPYQEFGQQYGLVSEVSRSAVSASDLSRMLGRSVDEPAYRVRVALNAQNVLAYGRQKSLAPGMTMEADVVFDNRRLIQWFIEPLYGFTHGFPSYASINDSVAR